MVLGASICTQDQRVVIEQHLGEKVDIELGYSHGHLRPHEEMYRKRNQKPRVKISVYIFLNSTHNRDTPGNTQQVCPTSPSQPGILGTCVPDFYCLKRRPD